MRIVWFKRDLRIEDHWPLVEAASRGPVVCLYVHEPELLASAEYDPQHHRFIDQSLRELDGDLRARGGWLVVRVGRMPDVLDELHRQFLITEIHSHEETGTGLTYDRDRRVALWARERGIVWSETSQNGVIRRLRSRDGWARKWANRMHRPLAPPPSRVMGDERVPRSAFPTAADLGLKESDREQIQQGGEREAWETLESFLEERGENYRREMSGPSTAEHSCSRISPYLAWGCISMAQVYQRLQRRREELRGIRDEGSRVGNWQGSLASFQSRLSWHCHFMQKLESDPSIEFQNLCRAYDGLREDEWDGGRYQAWTEGRTGYPMIDACMRYLRQTGWINFRMRAMLVSFASYHLWLHWRRPAQFLAREFLDFEPGIHFSQVQMQSGTTGINTIRIYSPIKQQWDQDPQGEFVRRYVPELSAVPLEFLADPQKMPLSMQERVGCRVGLDYPAPIVDHATAYRKARDRMYQVRGRATTRAEAKQVLAKHGSRKRPQRRSETRVKNERQRSLFDETEEN